MKNYTLYKKWFRKDDNPHHHFYWWYQYTNSRGKRIRKAAYSSHKPTNVQREAKAYLEQLNKFDLYSSPTLNEYASDFFRDDSSWVNWRRDFNIKDVTLEGHRNCLNNYIIKEFGNVSIADLQAKEIEEWLRELKDSKYSRKNLSSSTKNTIINTFTIILREAARDGISHNVGQIRRFKRNGEKKDIFTQEEYNKLFPENKKEFIKIWQGVRDNPDEGYMFGVFMAVMLSGGLRPGEARALQVNQIYKEGLYIDKQLDSAKIIALPKKGTENNPRDRIVALPVYTVKLLNKWVKDSQSTSSVFQYHGKPLNKSISSRRLRDACSRASIEIEGKNIAAYSLRYTYRSRMNNILPRATLMQFMGHSDGSVHDGYLKVIPEEQFQQIPDRVYEDLNSFW